MAPEDSESGEYDSGEHADHEAGSENEDTAARTVGERLHAARSEQGKSIKDIAAVTRITTRHLEAIEASDYDALPGRTYAVGFIKAYASAVGLPAVQLVSDLKDEMGHSTSSHHGGAGQELDDPSKIPSSRLAWVAALLGVAIIVGGYTIWHTYFYPRAEIDLVGMDAPDAAAETDDAGAAAQDDAPAAPTGGEVVFIAKEDDVWVRFYEPDGTRHFEGTMKLGERFVVPATAQNPQIRTGRPDALAITIDGQIVPPLSTEVETVGDVPINAAALLARPPAGAPAGNAPASGVQPSAAATPSPGPDAASNAHAGNISAEISPGENIQG